MPFTFSHPAIVLPLLNKHNKLFSATGLIIGSMAPDFESFIKVDDTRTYSHTWTGVFWFDLPLALAIAILFHAVVRDPLIINLPKPLAERFDAYRGFPWFSHLRKHFLVVLVSLIIGIISHMLWDALTHLDLGDPNSVASTISISGIRLYKILQFGCSFIGLVAIGWVVYRLPQQKVVIKVAMKYLYWLIMALLAVLIGVIITPMASRNVDIYMYPILFVYIPISSCLASLVIVSLIYTMLLKRGVWP